MRGWLVVGIFGITVLAGAGGWWWYRMEREKPVAGKVEITGNDPRVNIEYFSKDPEWEKYIKALGIFEKNGVIKYDGLGGRSTPMTVDRVKVYIEKDSQKYVLMRDENKNPRISWDIEYGDKEVTIRMNLNYDSYPAENRWKTVGSGLQGLIAYRLANISSKYHRAVNSGAGDAQMDAVLSLADPAKFSYLLVSSK